MHNWLNDGERLQIYDKERALIDLIKGNSGVITEYFSKAIALYVSQGIDLERLTSYSVAFPNEVASIKNYINMIKSTQSVY